MNEIKDYAINVEQEEKMFREMIPVIKIQQKKNELAETDYKLYKFLEGYLTEEEYEPIKVKRQALRDEINLLENEVKNNI